jgi:hypothetical protein
MINVGFVHSGYPELRNVLSVCSSNIKRVKCVDFFKLRDYVNFKLKNQTNFYLHNSFDDRFSYPKADVYHFFNG